MRITKDQSRKQTTTHSDIVQVFKLGLTNNNHNNNQLFSNHTNYGLIIFKSKWLFITKNHHDQNLCLRYERVYRF